jgi:hypothetical protein
MRVSRLAVAVLALLVTVLVDTGRATAAVPAGPGRASGFYTVLGGHDFQCRTPVTYYPRGMNVWILAGTPHVGVLRIAVAHAVGQARRYGVDVRYRGVAATRDAAVGTVEGLGAITVTESGTRTRACANPTGTSGLLREGVALPMTQNLGFIEEIENADITLCPQVWPGGIDYVTAVVMHELGHAVGLGHYPGTFHATPQLMNPVVPAGAPTTYQAGDVNGLRYLAYQARRVARLSVVRGAVEHWSTDRDQLTVSGWAITGRISLSTFVAITVDGQLASSFAADIRRPDITHRYRTYSTTPGFRDTLQLNSGTHRYCIVAIDPLHTAAPATLGCRELSRLDTSSSKPAPSAGATVHAAQEARDDPTNWLPVAAVLAAVLGLGAVGALVLSRRSQRRR